MYLKKIELIGFKSFPTKTTIQFADGVTSIVGPNGCGKTNVLDALRWVLGEQKPTLLRGGKMEEVIFNGTRELKPLGMAEVTLTIVNDRGILPTEYNEIQITRRLFRSGESEYHLNKVPCRLKDITDLFVDTGMGAHSYSVIQQHMIDSVISDKAEERRFLFEEAAGITKYKQRRKAALRKMETTENDFLRLQDIYAEIKTRVNSLYRQHKKAERYQKLSDRIKSWELYLGSNRFGQMILDKRQLQGQIDSFSDQKTGRQTALDQAYAALESERKDLVGIERQLSELGGQIQNITEEAHSLEREISVLAEKKSNAQHLIDKNRADIEAIKERSSALTEQMTQARTELGSQKELLDQTNEQLTYARQEQAAADSELLQTRAKKEDGNKQLLELEGQLSTGKAEENNLNVQKAEFQATIDEIERSVADNRPVQKQLVDSIEALRSSLAEVSALRNSKSERLTECNRRTEQLVTQSEETSDELANLGASLEACQARRNLLQELMLQYDGHESGLVATMEVKERWPQISGTVAEKFVPVQGMETVLEAALGDIAGFLICYERKAAEEIIEFLRAEKKGKIGILVPDSGTLTPAVKRPELDLPGVLGWLDSYVSTEERLRPLMSAVLSRTIVFEAGTAPDELLGRLPYGFAAVSSDGVFYTSNKITGGSDDSFPLFRRKEKVAEQDQQIALLEEQLSTTKAAKNKLVAEMAALRAESTELTGDLETLAEEIETVQGRLTEKEFEYRTLAAEFDRLSREKQALAARLEKIGSRQYSLGLDSTELANRKEDLVDSLDQSGSHLEKLEQRATQATGEVSRLQISAIEARSKAEQTESRLGHLEELSADLNKTQEEKAAEIEQAVIDIKTSGETTGSNEDRLKTCFERRDEITKKQDGLRAVQTELLEKTSVREDKAKALRHDKDTVAEELHKAEIRMATIESETAALAERIREEYQLDVSSLEAVRPQEDVADDKVHELLPQLKEKLRSFGAVNLLALEEYGTASEREKFLKEQLADLSEAKNDLKSTINKINNTARNMFNDTFLKVRTHFQALFVDLFAGGEADIRLVDPDDPLESDIDIIARPGGKKLLPITILSGGERALTAISLLFSLYLVKPSPFCILDEIYAPLDDANCHRFLSIIHKFSRQTQFIIITHNKITMEAANNLYGITMEKPGVSKLVAVRFAETDGNGSGRIEQVSAEEPEAEFAPATSDLPAAIQERITPDITVRKDSDN